MTPPAVPTKLPLPSLAKAHRMPSTGKPCHNCRRRRLRCDRSWPSCHKCTQAGQECQGYGKIFTWTQAIDANGSKPRPALDHSPVTQASPLTSTAPDLIGFPSAKAPSAEAAQALGSLTDPLFQDLDRNSRYYLSHCASAATTTTTTTTTAHKAPLDVRCANISCSR